MPQFKECLRLNVVVRAPQIKAQKLIQNSGALPYALVPAYDNYGDKRNFNIENNTPFPRIRKKQRFFIQ